MTSLLLVGLTMSAVHSFSLVRPTVPVLISISCSWRTVSTMQSRCERCPFVAKSGSGLSVHDASCRRKLQRLNPEPEPVLPAPLEDHANGGDGGSQYEYGGDGYDERRMNPDATGEGAVGGGELPPPLSSRPRTGGQQTRGSGAGAGLKEEKNDGEGDGGAFEEQEQHQQEEGDDGFEAEDFFEQPEHYAGGGGAGSRYIPNRLNACAKFLDIQMAQPDYDVNPTPSVNGPIARLLKLSEEDLDTAILQNDLVLSRAATDSIIKFTERACSRRTGQDEHLKSVQAVMEKVKNACDRSQDDGVSRHAVYHIAAPPRDIPEDVDFMWIDVIHSVIELLTDAHLSTQTAGYLWKPAALGASYAELNTGTWWHTVHENSLAEETGFDVVPIILATDGSAQDFRRSLSIQPINITVGNFPGSVQRTDASKRCIGYWPDIKTKSKTVEHERLQRRLYQWVLGNITGNIAEYKDGFLLKVALRGRRGMGG